MLRLPTNITLIITITICIAAYLVNSLLVSSSNQTLVNFFPSISVALTVVALLATSFFSRTVSSNHLKSNAQVENMATLYVGNLPYKANEKDIREHFSKTGSVISVRLVKDKKSGRRKGFGFVEIEAMDENMFINKLNNTLYMDRNIIVRPANDKP